MIIHFIEWKTEIKILQYEKEYNDNHMKILYENALWMVFKLLNVIMHFLRHKFSVLQKHVKFMAWNAGWYVHPHRYYHLGQCNFAYLGFCYPYVVRKNPYFLDQPLAHRRELFSGRSTYQESWRLNCFWDLLTLQWTAIDQQPIRWKWRRSRLFRLYSCLQGNQWHIPAE